MQIIQNTNVAATSTVVAELNNRTRTPLAQTKQIQTADSNILIVTKYTAHKVDIQSSSRCRW